MSIENPGFSESFEHRKARMIEAGPEFKPELEPQLLPLFEMRCKYCNALVMVYARDIIAEAQLDKNGLKVWHFYFRCTDCKLLNVVPKEVVETNQSFFSTLTD